VDDAPSSKAASLCSPTPPPSTPPLPPTSVPARQPRVQRGLCDRSLLGHMQLPAASAQHAACSLALLPAWVHSASVCQPLSPQCQQQQRWRGRRGSQQYGACCDVGEEGSEQCANRNFVPCIMGLAGPARLGHSLGTAARMVKAVNGR
jgi:hypothetical protein